MGTLLLITIRGGVALLLLLPLVVTPSTVFPFVVGKALYSRVVIEIIFALWLILILKYPQYRPHRSIVLSAFAFYLMVTLMAGLAGVSFHRSLWSNYERMQGIWDLVHWFAFLGVLGSVIRGQSEWRLLFSGTLMVGIFVGLLGLAEQFEISVPVFWFLQSAERLEITVGNAGYAGIYMLVHLMLALGLLTSSFRSSPVLTGRKFKELRQQLRQERMWLRWMRAFWLLSAVLSVVILFLTGTRAVLFGLIVGLIIVCVGYVVWGSRKSLRVIMAGVGGLVLIGVIVLPLVNNTSLFQSVSANSDLLQRFSGARVAEALTNRWVVARPGIKGFLARPILGWGPENYSIVYDRYVLVKDIGELPVLAYDQAHNRPVEELSTKGILGFGAYIILWVAAFWILFVKVRRRDQDQWLYLFVVGALASYFTASLFWFDSATTLLVLVLLFGWLISLESDLGNESLSSVGTNTDQIAIGQPSRKGSNNTKFGRSEVYIPYLGLVAVIITLLGVSIYMLNYRPFRAAQAVYALSTPLGEIRDSRDLRPIEDVLSKTLESASYFSPLSTLPARMMIQQVLGHYDSLSMEKWAEAFPVAVEQGKLAIEREPRNPKLYMAVARVYQTGRHLNPTHLGMAKYYVEMANKFAPQHPDVQHLVATQQLLQGDAEGALLTMDRSVSLNPGMEIVYRSLREFVEEVLSEQRDKQ